MTVLAVFYIIAAILLLASFIGFVVYSAKGGNLLIGLLVMATIWFILGAITNLVAKTHTGLNVWNSIVKDMTKVFQDGPANYGGTIAVIIFASWFGRVLVDTGIAKNLIRRVVELAGDRQLVTVLLVSLVSALMFTSIFGAGSVIAMGTIILPILFSIGVKKKLAVGSFIMSVAAGMYVNGGYDSQFSGNSLFKNVWLIDGFKGSFTLFTWLAFLVHLVIMVAFILFNFYVNRDKVRAWALPDTGGNPEFSASLEPEKVSGWTFLVPFIPIIIALVIAIINIIFSLAAKKGTVPISLSTIPVNVGFIVASLVGLGVTGNLRGFRKTVNSVQKTMFNGITDVALLIAMLLILNMFSTSAGLVEPIITNVLGDSMSWISSSSGQWILMAAFIVLAPLALFRGPFMIWGSGIALATVFYTLLGGASGTTAGIVGAYPILLALFYVQPVGMVANSCPTQSWNMWALSYSNYEAKDFIFTNVLWSWGIVGINILLAFLIFARIS